MLGCVYNDVFHGVAQTARIMDTNMHMEAVMVTEANTVMETMGMDMVTVTAMAMVMEAERKRAMKIKHKNQKQNGR